VACVPPQTSFLLDKTGFQNSDICEIFSVSNLTKVVIRGIEIGKDVMYEFNLKKMSRGVITCNLRCASSGTRSVRKRPVVP
jgi:hypothetical protein